MDVHVGHCGSCKKDEVMKKFIVENIFIFSRFVCLVQFV